MAGSYRHVTGPDGQLLGPRAMDAYMDNAGDRWEAYEELYGMVWYLAFMLDLHLPGPSGVAQLVEEARQNYQQGVQGSPGVNGRKPEENDE